MRLLKKVFNGIHLFTVWLAILQLLAMTLIISAQVFCRSVLGFSIPWSEEVALVLVIWFSFIALAIGVKENLHIAIELFTMKVPEKILKTVIFRLTYAVVFFVGLVMVIYGIQLAENGLTSTLPATGWPTSFEYIFLPVSGILLIYDALMNFLGIDKEDRHIDASFMRGGRKNA